MGLFRNALPLLVALGATLVAGCATPQRGPAEWDGLVRQPGGRIDAVFVRPDAEIPAFRSVLLEPVSISFASNWDPGRGGRSLAMRMSAADVQGIKDELAVLFQETFRAELARGGYTLVTEPGPETVRVTPFIVDLYITAPDNMPAGRTRVYTANSGRMTLVVELRDSVSSQIIARAVDTRTGRGAGMWNATNTVTNTADARRAITVWATALRDGLDQLYKRNQ
jgi:hypothetical protein